MFEISSADHCFQLLIRTAVALTVLSGIGVAQSSVPGLIQDKTLVAWVQLADYTQDQTGVLAIQRAQADPNEFDAIAYGWHHPRRWVNGSHNSGRTQLLDRQRELAVEEAASNETVCLAIACRGNRVSVYRNGRLYDRYEAPNRQTYSVDDSNVFLGLRCFFDGKLHGYFKGAILEARIYNIALPEDQITRLTPGKIEETQPLGCWDFSKGSNDLMGNFPNSRFIGGAKVENGRLLLDGRGFLLVSRRNDIQDPRGVQTGFYTVKHRPKGSLWDTWMYYHEGVYYLYYLTQSGKTKSWDSHEVALSTDGVHWRFEKATVQTPAGTKGFGTGHIWKSPDFEKNHLWISNYHGADGDNSFIRFVTSKDLLNWELVDKKYSYYPDPRWYQQACACLDVIKGDDGYYYSHFSVGQNPPKDPGYPYCKFGFVRSKDTLSWESLPPLHGELDGEVGGIEKIGNKYYMTISEGRIGVSDSIQGPFHYQKKNTCAFGKGDTYFPRFFHNAPDGPLMNVFFIRRPCYAAPLKAIEVDDQDILRVTWWPGNNALKTTALSDELESIDENRNVVKARYDTNHTTVIEAEITLADDRTGNAGLAGLYFANGNNTAVEAVLLGRDQTYLADVDLTKSGAAPVRIKKTCSRDLDFGTRQKVRLVLFRDLMEVYVNDYLTILSSRVGNFGRIGAWRGDHDNRVEHVQVWTSAPGT